MKLLVSYVCHCMILSMVSLKADHLVLNCLDNAQYGYHAEDYKNISKFFNAKCQRTRSVLWCGRNRYAKYTGRPIKYRSQGSHYKH